MVHSDIDRLGLPPGLADLIKTFGDKQPPEWFNLPVFWFYYSLQQFDANRRYTKDYVEFGQLQTVMGQVYQCGSILGYLQRRRGADMMRLSTGRVQGDANNLLVMSRRKAKERVDRYRRATGESPMSVEVMQYVTGYLERGVSPLTDVKGVRVVAHERVPLVDAKGYATPTFNEGIAFSITYPTLWRKAMTAYDADRRELSAMSDIQPPEMRELSDLVVDFSQTWAQMCRPDLLHLIPESGQAKPNK